MAINAEHATEVSSKEDSASPSMALTKPAIEKPPPGASTSLNMRRYILASFWAIIALIGLPIWIYTTSVPRAPLPLDAMHKWASGQACQFEFPLHVAVEADRPQDTQHLVKLVQQTLDDQDVPSLHHLRIQPAGPSKTPPAVTVRMRSDPDAEEITATTMRYEPTLEVRHPPLSGSPHASGLAPLARTVADQLRSLFEEEQAMLLHLLASAGRPIPDVKSFANSVDALRQRSMRTFKYAPTYHLTFSLFSGSASPAVWDIKDALDENLQPLLSSISLISNFTLDTQVQLYASLPPSMHGPQFDDKTKRWLLERDDLSGFINAAEWPLNPSIGAGPTINFVLYVPAEKQQPLLLKDNGGTSWLIPQWGAVQLLNPTPAQVKSGKLSKEDLQPVILTFAEQLVTLLGLPRKPSSLPIQMGTLTRERAASLILSASSTLGALARLTLKLTSIAIPTSVAQSVDKTIAHLDHACADFRNARYTSALEHAREAEAEAEQAFFEPSMVGQVYFPDEHKVAVYVPLLGPMAVPLVMALLKEIKRFRAGRAGATTSPR